MWRLALFFCISGIVGAGGLLAAENFPYTAYIADEDVEVRAGPGTNFYATDRLAYRTAVEVYRRDPGGWLAIRPPENSYCWVPASKLWMTQQKGIAEVVADDTLSWVGSRVESVGEHKWQVRMQRGERVEVLGEKRVLNEGQGTAEAWYQIAPPAGEFRWIHDRSVSRESGDIATAASPPQWSRSRTSKSDSQVRVASYVEESKQADIAKGGPPLIQQTADKTPIAPIPKAAPRVRENVASLVTPDDIKAFDRQAMLDSGTARPKAGADDQFTDLEAQLALMVSKEPSFWHLEKLHDQAEALVESGKTPLERGRARLVLDKIAQFEDLQRRQIRVEKQVKVAAGGEDGGSTAEAGIPTGAIPPRFDGSGWLVPVHSTKRAAPPYAILDDDGKVLEYVTPAPGLNLNRYLKKRVGVYGQKSTIASLNAPHLTAHRIVDLERHGLR